MRSYGRKYFKRSKSLLKKPASSLNEEQMDQVSLSLEMNSQIKEAYKLKELFYEYVLVQKDKESASKALKEWIRRSKVSALKEFEPCIRAYTNCFDEITNSFDYEWTNAYVEGTHNKFKTIKRVSFGMPNFNHFRTKLLMACS